MISTSGSDFYTALCAGKRITWLAAACIAATLVCIDVRPEKSSNEYNLLPVRRLILLFAVKGPLLQRASSTQSSIIHQPVNLFASVVPEIPAYFTGYYKFVEGWDQAEFSEDILSVLKEFSSNVPMTDIVRGCQGICTATIRAPALIATHCTSNTTHKNYTTPYTRMEMKSWENGIVPPSRVLFGSALNSAKGTVETLDFHIDRSGDEVASTCAGPFHSTHCYLRSAIADYKVLVTNNTVALQDAANPSLVSWANNTELTESTISRYNLRKTPNSNWIKTTLGGVVNAFNYEYQFSVGANPPKASERLHITTYSSTSWFLLQQTKNYEQYSDGSACSYAWKEPRLATMVSLIVQRVNRL